VRLLLCVLLPTRVLLWWRRRKPEPQLPSATAPKSIILFRLDALGDLVLTTPLIRELKRSFSGTPLTVVAQPPSASILQTNPHIDELLTLPVVRTRWLPAHARRFFSALRFYWCKLRRRSFDIAISPRWDTDEHLATFLCLLTNAGARVGYCGYTSFGKRRYNRGFDRAFDICLEPGPPQHEVEKNLAIVKALGGAVHEKRLEIHLTAEDEQHADRQLRSLPDNCTLVALGIGAQSKGRRWPLERYAAVICDLTMQYPVYAVITCSPSEHAEAVRLAGMLSTRAVISDNANVRESCALLGRCDLFIGNDSGAAHLAAAMKCPTIVISRHPKAGDAAHSNSPARFAPWSPSARVLQPDRGLEGCEARCTHIEPHCITQITVAEVVRAAKGMLLNGTHDCQKPAESVVVTIP